MSNFYCEYCGTKSSSISSLTANSCHRHLLGNGKGKHKLYEGSEKSQYTCKCCGSKYSTLSSLCSSSCSKSDTKKHQPAL